MSINSYLPFNIEGQSRILFFLTPKDKDPTTGKEGILAHTWFESLIRKILYIFNCSKGIIDININGNLLHLNRGSVERWCHRHGSLLLPTENAALKIDSIVKRIYQQIKELMDARKVAAEEMAKDHIEALSKICFNENNTLNTKLLRNGRQLPYQLDRHLLFKDPTLSYLIEEHPHERLKIAKIDDNFKNNILLRLTHTVRGYITKKREILEPEYAERNTFSHLLVDPLTQELLKEVLRRLDFDGYYDMDKRNLVRL